MQLEHSFDVPGLVEDAWSVLLDVERIAPIRTAGEPVLKRMAGQADGGSGGWRVRRLARRPRCCSFAGCGATSTTTDRRSARLATRLGEQRSGAGVLAVRGRRRGGPRGGRHLSGAGRRTQ